MSSLIVHPSRDVAQTMPSGLDWSSPCWRMKLNVNSEASPGGSRMIRHFCAYAAPLLCTQLADSQGHEMMLISHRRFTRHTLQQISSKRMICVHPPGEVVQVVIKVRQASMPALRHKVAVQLRHVARCVLYRAAAARSRPAAAAARGPCVQLHVWKTAVEWLPYSVVAAQVSLQMNCSIQRLTGLLLTSNGSNMHHAHLQEAGVVAPQEFAHALIVHLQAHHQEAQKTA